MFKKFMKDENGQGMVEYALILALIAIVVIVAVTALGNSTKNKMNNVASALDNAGNSN